MVVVRMSRAERNDRPFTGELEAGRAFCVGVHAFHCSKSEPLFGFYFLCLIFRPHFFL